MAGWIKIYRDLADHWLADDLEKLGWWTILLLKVNNEDRKVLSGNQLVELKRGQIIASLTYLATLWKTSKRTAERFLELLEKDGMVRRCTSRKVTILTICNYESYQENKGRKVADVCADDEPIGIQSVSEKKNEEEVKEIYTNPAHTREGKVSWDASTEQGYCEAFKAKGSAIPMGKVVGKSGAEILALLDVYMADRQVKDKGHRNYNEFVGLFKWHVENNKIRVHEEPQQRKSRNIMEMYG